jgi:hypothetical protein
MMEAEIGVRLPQAKECLGLLEAVRVKGGSTTRDSREHGFDNTLISDF